MADFTPPPPADLFDDLLALTRRGWSLRFEPVDDVTRALDLSIFISPPPESSAVPAYAVFDMYNTPQQIPEFVHAVRLYAIPGDTHV